MNKNTLSPLIKDFIFPAVAVVFVLLLSLLFLVPKIRQTVDLRKEIKLQETQITGLSQKLADLQTLSEAELFDSSSLLLEALLPEKDYFKMLYVTKKIFSDNNVFLKSFRFSPGVIASSSTPSKTGADLENMLLDITYDASSFSDFINFSKTIDKTIPLLEIDSVGINLKISTESASLPGFEGILKIKGFFSSLPKTLGRPEDPLPKISIQNQKLIEDLRTYLRYQPEAGLAVPVLVGKENPFSF